MQATSRRQAVVLSAAQKAEYIWADGLEGAEEKVRASSNSTVAALLSVLSL